MNIGFTGTQSGLVTFQIEQVREILKLKQCSEFIHGDCIGADDMANSIALELGIKQFTIHPPDNPKKRAFCFDSEHRTAHLRQHTPFILIQGIANVRWYPIEPYLERNKRIVDNCSFLIACPKEHKHSVRSGTWS